MGKEVMTMAKSIGSWMGANLQGRGRSTKRVRFYQVLTIGTLLSLGHVRFVH